jgi:hypothetical protein
MVSEATRNKKYVHPSSGRKAGMGYQSYSSKEKRGSIFPVYFCVALTMETTMMTMMTAMATPMMIRIYTQNERTRGREKG